MLEVLNLYRKILKLKALDKLIIKLSTAQARLRVRQKQATSAYDALDKEIRDKQKISS